MISDTNLLLTLKKSIRHDLRLYAFVSDVCIIGSSTVADIFFIAVFEYDIFEEVMYTFVIPEHNFALKCLGVSYRSALIGGRYGIVMLWLFAVWNKAI